MEVRAIAADAPELSAALEAAQLPVEDIHEAGRNFFTLESLAHEIGLSRTTFADRFVQYVGMPPMQYLARWRMQLAARQLETPGLSIGQVAANVGYESEAAFNRAFKKLIGTTPGHWRKRGAERRPSVA